MAARGHLQPLAQGNGFPLRPIGGLACLRPGSLAAGRVLFQPLRFLVQKGNHLGQLFQLELLAGHLLPQVADLARRDADLGLDGLEARLHALQPAAQRGLVRLGHGDLRIEVGDLPPQVAQLALPRDDARPGEQGADGERAVGLQQLAGQGEEAQPPAGRTRRGPEAARVRQVVCYHHVAEHLSRQAREGRVLAAKVRVGGRRQFRQERIDGRGPALVRAERYEAHTPRDWPEGGNQVVQPRAVADDEALRRLAERQVDQRRDLARHGQQVGGQADHVREHGRRGGRRRVGADLAVPHGGFRNAAEDLPHAGADPLQAALQAVEHVHAAQEVAAADAQAAERGLQLLAEALQVVPLALELRRAGAGVRQPLLNRRPGMRQAGEGFFQGLVSGGVLFGLRAAAGVVLAELFELFALRARQGLEGRGPADDFELAVAVGLGPLLQLGEPAGRGFEFAADPVRSLPGGLERVRRGGRLAPGACRVGFEGLHAVAEVGALPAHAEDFELQVVGRRALVRECGVVAGDPLLRVGQPGLLVAQKFLDARPRRHAAGATARARPCGRWRPTGRLSFP